MLHGLQLVRARDRLDRVGEVDGRPDRRIVLPIEHLACLLATTNVTRVIAFTCHAASGEGAAVAAEPFRASITPKPRSTICATGCAGRGWPEPEPVHDWSQGVPLARAQELCRSWAEDYDFGFAERLNAFPQYRDLVTGWASTSCTSARRSRTRSRWCSRTVGRARCSSSWTSSAR
ncbi:hypothetical protein GCM10020366_70880 [Saccharopolyspora gregorii]|uniref:Epoxide hydrolase N-terminal domain-containing protein n=1 Tax=Saccharopolyspora gregorii TaxID=33914 RepID=A0ABP6S2T4_9PSEU